MLKRTLCWTLKTALGMMLGKANAERRQETTMSCMALTNM